MELFPSGWFSHWILTLQVVIIITCMFETGESIKCYICQGAYDNRFCSTPEHLSECEGSRDTCQTRVSYSKTDGYSITKRCVIGPCSLTNANQNIALGLDCDRSSPNWECESCCQEDNCNVDGVPRIGASVLTTIVFSMICVIGIKNDFFS